MGTTRSGVGFADTTDSRDAGRRAAEKAMANASIEQSDFTVAFCGGNHDPMGFLKAVRSVVGEKTLVGGTAVGVITNERASYGGYEAGVAVVKSSAIRFDAMSVGGLDESEEKAGKTLGSLLAGRSRPDSRGILLFYDSVRTPQPLRVNLASQLVRGVEAGLAGPHVPVLGGGMMKDYQWSGSHVFAGDAAMRQHAVGVLVSGDCSIHHAISHGCEPASDYHTITSIEGPVVKELDGKPALSVIEDIIGVGAGKDWQQYSLLVTLGANKGDDPYGEFDENAYMNRLIAGVNPNDGSVVLFESDFGPGEKVQIMRRSNEHMLSSAQAISTDLLKRVEKANPFLALYIDCAGRTSGFCGAGAEEGAIIQQTIGSKMPLLGFYSGVEIAPFMQGSRALDWTGVLIAFTED
ncbi:MAG: FIST C-terminal domain-containing protein [Candidatus Eisenbacteria bacterium]|nr:FIST C-terminal domain-containing protein [Candidatus Eisenbacteria bacterium]